MARKSSIFLTVGLVLLALLMGCSNETKYPDVPSDVVITQATDFLEGQTFNSSNFTVSVKYLYSNGYRDVPASILTFNDNDKNGVVSFGDTVTASAGTDLNGKAVEKTADINVYAIDYITAVATVEAFAWNGSAATIAVTPDQVEVTAHYAGDQTLVLTSTDYSAGPIAIDVDKNKDNETFESNFRVTLAESLAAKGTVGSEYLVPVVVSQSISSELEEVQSVTGFATNTYNIPKFDYADADDLASYLDASKIKVNATGIDNLGKKTTKSVTADTIEGLELSFVNAETGLALTDFDSLKYATGSNFTGLAITGTFNDAPVNGKVTVGLYQDTALKVQYNGEGIVIGTKNTDLDLNDFRVLLTVNGETSDITDEVSAEDFYFATSNKDDTDKTVVNDTYSYVGVKYKGADTAAAGLASITTKSQYVDYTLGSMTITLDEDFALNPQYYPEGKVLDLVKGAITSIKVTKTAADKSTSEVVIDVNDPNLTLTLTTDGINAYDYEKAVSTIKLGASYEYGAEDTVNLMTPVDVTVASTATITSVVLEPEYEANPAIGDPITWKVTVNGTDGGWVLQETTLDVKNKSVGSLAVRYFIDGVEYKTATFGGTSKTYIPTTIGETAVENIIVKVGDVNSEAVDLVAGRWYVAPTISSLVAEVTDEYAAKAYIDSEISVNVNDYALTEESIKKAFGVSNIEDIPAQYLPKIVEIIPAVDGAKVVSGDNANSVNVVVTYVDKSGATQRETLTNAVAFTGKAWTDNSGAYLTLEDEKIENNQLEAGAHPYDFDIAGLVDYGTVTAGKLIGYVKGTTWNGEVSSLTTSATNFSVLEGESYTFVYSYDGKTAEYGTITINVVAPAN